MTATRRPGIAAVIICMNEEDRIRACLESVAWCDEIVVVDSESTDRTREIAAHYTDRVIVRPWPGYVAQQAWALQQATQPWVLSVDADERCSPALRAQIEAAFVAGVPPDVAGYSMPRRTWYLGRWIRHSGWYPDRKLRLVRSDLAEVEGQEPHYYITVGARRVLPLSGDIEHYTYRNFADQMRTVMRFSHATAKGWHARGKRYSLLGALVHPQIKFLETYIYKLGILDGWPGLVIAAANSFGVFCRYVHLRELERGDAERSTSPPQAPGSSA